MTIEITEFADAVISISPTGVSTGNFGILGFLTNEVGISVPQRGKAYQSLEEVTADWLTSSEVYKAAVAFYAQTPTPKDFTVIAQFVSDQPAVLMGGGHDVIADLVAINAGSFDLTVDGTTATVLVDFSADTTLAEVAITVNVALATAVLGATCVYGAYGFIITSDTTGVTSTMSFATGDTGEALGLQQHQGLVSDGIASETPVQALAVAKNKGIEIVGLDLIKDLRDQSSVADGLNTTDIADWCEAEGVIFMNTSNDLSCLNSALSTDTPSQLKLKTLRYTHSTFARNINQYPGASIFGRAASVNFEGINTTITLNLKQMPTITAEDLTSAELATLRSKNCNAVIQIGKTATGFTDSRMASGSWFDTTHGLMWLENRIETDMFNLLYTSNTKVPYTQLGINIAKEVLERSLIAAVRNGLCAPGVLPDGTYLPEGFVIESVALVDVPAGDKSNRIYRGLSFKMVGAGALHEVLVTGEFSE